MKKIISTTIIYITLLIITLAGTAFAEENTTSSTEVSTPTTETVAISIMEPIPPLQNESLDYCLDSDGGRNYYEYGGVKMPNNPDWGTYGKKYDTCWDDNIHLQEYVCIEGTYYGDETYECPNGCEDGRCIDTGDGKSYPSLELLTPAAYGYDVKQNGVTSPVCGDIDTNWCSKNNPNADNNGPFEFDWGDGEKSCSWFAAKHTYNKKGTYNIEVRVKNSCGFISSRTSTIDLSNQSECVVDSDCPKMAVGCSCQEGTICKCPVPKDPECINGKCVYSTTTCERPICKGVYFTGEYDSNGCPVYGCPPIECKIPACEGAYETGEYDSYGCKKYECPSTPDVELQLDKHYIVGEKIKIAVKNNLDHSIFYSENSGTPKSSYSIMRYVYYEQETEIDRLILMDPCIPWPTLYKITEIKSGESKVIDTWDQIEYYDRCDENDSRKGISFNSSVGSYVLNFSYYESDPSIVYKCGGGMKCIGEPVQTGTAKATFKIVNQDVVCSKPSCTDYEITGTDENGCAIYKCKNNTSPSCNMGCMLKDRCVLQGTRTSINDSKMFCSIDGAWNVQYSDDNECSNNYECTSNLCVDSKCISSGLINKLLNWLKNLF